MEDLRGCEDASERDALARLAAARTLTRLWRANDDEGLESALSELFAGDIGRRLYDVEPKVLALLRDAFEALDDFLFECVLGPRTSEIAWRRLFVPDENGLPLPQLLMNAYWLRICGSPRVCVGAALPEPAVLGRMSGAQQGLLLARFCLRHDAGTALDLVGLSEVLDERLRSMFETWLFRVYLMSPTDFADDEVQGNRRGVVRDYARATADWEVTSWDPASTVPLYRSSYITEHEREFVEAALVRRLEPGIERVLGPGDELPPRTDALGLVTSVWTAPQPVHRCLAPLVEGIKSPALECFPLERDVEEHPSPEGWRAGDVLELSTPSVGSRATLVEHARFIASRKLDFLFYPEVGLRATARRLASRRLARVQAMGYGHPATSGARTMDYFVGGRDVEVDPRRYRERLVLLPGLGVSSTPPPLPRVTRQRPLDDDRVLVMNASSFDKLNPDLLDAWGDILFESPDARLQMFPAWTRGRCERELPMLSRFLPGARTRVVSRVPRQVLIDRLEDVDVYLDSYPFGGFNTLMEVLCAGVPFVTFEGRLARNRFGAALLRMLDMPEELIARSWPEYVEAAGRLVRDKGWRLELRARLGRERVLAVLDAQNAGEHFAAAVEWMRAAGPSTGAPQAPVLIRAGEAPRELDQLGNWP